MSIFKQPLSDGSPICVIVASKNPVKIDSIGGALRQLFPSATVKSSGVAVESGVSDQPMSNDETKQGALNRLAKVRELHPDADLWAGVEGGIELEDGGMNAFAWIILESADQHSAVRTASFPLPRRVVELIREGVELGHANDIVFDRQNSKHSEGAIGTLTQGLIGRRALYEHAAIMALIPMKNYTLFGPST